MDADLISYESMLAAQKAADWAYWSMVATWVSGIATFMAVALSLYLANRRPRAHVTANVAWCFLNNGKLNASGIGITVANASDNTIVISSISWEMGGDKKLAQIFEHILSTPMPTKLSGGESAFYFIEVGDDLGWLKTIVDNIRKSNGNIDKLKLCVGLASGVQKRFRVKSLSEALKEIELRDPDKNNQGVTH